MLRSTIVLGFIASLVITSGALAQRDGLKAGSDAPRLDVAEWIKGSETEIKAGNVYVVEFWATWCAPCRKSIPHLSELQRKYRGAGLTIVGVALGEEEDVVRPFVDRQGDNMDYTVVVDRRSNMKRDFMDAAGLSGIPAAFIIDREQKIAWIGNPLDPAFDEVLGKVMANRYNPKLEREAEPILAAARSARRMRNWRMAHQQYEQVIKLDPRVFTNVAIERFKMMLLDMNEVDAAYDYAKKDLIEGSFADDAGVLREFASMIATDPSIPEQKRRLDVALAAAEKAQAVAGANDPRTLATLALIRYHQNELTEAVDLQKRAYLIAQPSEKSDYRRVLTSYMEASGRRDSR